MLTADSSTSFLNANPRLPPARNEAHHPSPSDSNLLPSEEKYPDTPPPAAKPNDFPYVVLIENLNNLHSLATAQGRADFVKDLADIHILRSSITRRRELWLALPRSQDINPLLELNWPAKLAIPRTQVRARKGRKPQTPRYPQIFLINVDPHVTIARLKEIFDELKMPLAPIENPILCFNAIPDVPFKARVALAEHKHFLALIRRESILDKKNHLSFLVRKSYPKNPKYQYCKKCYGTDHETFSCPKPALCPRCLEPEHENACKRTMPCVNCGKPHPSNSPECETLKKLKWQQRNEFHEQARPITDNAFAQLHAQVQSNSLKLSQQSNTDLQLTVAKLEDKVTALDQRITHVETTESQILQQLNEQHQQLRGQREEQKSSFHALSKQLTDAMQAFQASNEELRTQLSDVITQFKTESYKRDHELHERLLCSSHPESTTPTTKHRDHHPPHHRSTQTNIKTKTLSTHRRPPTM